MSVDLMPDPNFLRDLNREDELGLVVRAHIHVEAALYRLLELSFPKPEFIPRLRYEQRVLLLQALGRDDGFGPALKTLGDIRNVFGHRVDSRLEQELVSKLFGSFPSGEQKFMLDFHAKENQGRSFHDRPTRDQFILLVIALRSTLDHKTRDTENAA